MSFASNPRSHSHSLALALAAVVSALPAAASTALARDHEAAPPLPAPGGTVVNVSTVSALEDAVQNLQSNTTVMIAAGTYQLSSTLWVRPNGSAISNVGIRGATGDPDDVVLVGIGMSNASFGNVPHGIHVGNVNGITIADLTIEDVYYHPIQLAGELGCTAPRIYNCRLVDAGEQFIKGSPRASGDGVDNGVVEYTSMEYTTTARSDYTNGVDIHGGDGWVIRHNLFRRILAPPGGGLAGPAVLMWNRSRNTVCEGNTFIDCARGIHFGLDAGRSDDHSGGVIRNNFFYRSGGTAGDLGIGVFNSPSTKVLHNTVLLSGTYPNAVEYRFGGTTGIEVRSNLTDGGIHLRDGASGTVAGNVTNAQVAWFVNAAAGDLHLGPAAAGAIDLAQAHASVVDDWDGGGRPVGAAPDVGADERGGPTIGGIVPETVPAGSGAFTLIVNGSGFTGTCDVLIEGSGRATSFVDPTELRASILTSDVATAGARAVTVLDAASGATTSAAVLSVVGQNPVPVVSTTDPTSVTVGSGAFALQVDGSGFVSGSVVRMNASDRPTVFVTPTRLEASISASDAANVGSVTVSVFNPPPGGGVSNGFAFEVLAGGGSGPPGGGGSSGGGGGSSGGGGSQPKKKARGGGGGCALGPMAEDGGAASAPALLPLALLVAGLALVRRHPSLAFAPWRTTTRQRS